MKQVLSEPDTVRNRAGRVPFLIAVALVAVQPSFASQQAPVVALSDAFLVLTAFARLGALPRVPDNLKAPLVLIGAALTGGWLTTGFLADASLIWATTRLVGYFVVVLYLLFAYKFGEDPRFIVAALRAFVFVTLTVNLLLLDGMPTKSLMAALIPIKFDSRLSGGLYDPNANGAALACCLLLVAFSGRIVRSFALRVATFAALAYCLVQTLSRGAFVELAMAVIVIAIVAFWRRPGILIASGLAGASTFAVFKAMGVVAAVQESLAGRPDSSLDNRFFYIEDAIRAFEANPAIGAGLGSATERNGAVVHATFFWLLGDVGVLGALGFALFLAVGLRTAAGLISRGCGLGIAGSLVAMSVASFSIEALYQRHWWVLLGFAIALAHKKREAHE